MEYLLRTVFLLLSLLSVITSSVAEVAVPPLFGHITDTAGLLNSSTRQSLESALKNFEHSKGPQITVLTIKSTEGEAIEQFALRVGEKWKIGRKRIDDGAILVIAAADRAVRIEVGYGLEGALPDATCKQIIENYILPRFREGDFNAGIEAGVQSILKKLSGEPLPAPRAENSVDWVLIIIIAVWLFIVFYQLSHAPAGRVYTSRRNSGYWGGGGGGWSSGGGGGGGFSGGGGSFGGGGASGRW